MPAFQAEPFDLGTDRLESCAHYLGTGERCAVVVRDNLSRRGAVAVQADTDRRFGDRFVLPR